MDRLSEPLGNEEPWTILGWLSNGFHQIISRLSIESTVNCITGNQPLGSEIFRRPVLLVKSLRFANS